MPAAPNFGVNVAAINAAEVDAEPSRLLFMEAVAPATPSIAFVVDFARPVPTPEVVFVVPPYGSRLYERSNVALFEVVPDHQYFRVPPPGDAGYLAPNAPVLIAVEASRTIFLVSGRRA